MLKSSYIAQYPVILWLETLQYLFWESLEISNTTKFQVKYICYRYSTFPLRCLRRNRSLQSCRTFSSTPCQVHRMDLQNTGCSSMLTNCGLGKWQLARETKPHKTASKFTANIGFKISNLGINRGHWCLLILLEQNSIFLQNDTERLKQCYEKQRWCVLALLPHGLSCYWLLPSIAWDSLNRSHAFTTFHLLLQHHLESGDSLEEMVLHGD